jgi:TetR/AcrR family transcriptional regulator, tetracycline repressor protein
MRHSRFENRNPHVKYIGNETETAPRRRGRPSSLNRATVIATALRLIEKKPDHVITMSEVADELGVVTMGIYKHVRNKDDLLAGMAEQVFAELDLRVDANRSLDERFLQWAGKYRDFFIAHPYANHLIAWHNRLSADFMSWCGDLVGMLDEYGVKKGDQARTLAWLVRQLNAYVLLEQGTAINRVGDHGKLVEGFDITTLTKDKQSLLKPLLAELATHTSDDFYRFHIEATLGMLKQVAGAADKGFTRGPRRPG